MINRNCWSHNVNFSPIVLISVLNLKINIYRCLGIKRYRKLFYHLTKGLEYPPQQLFCSDNSYFNKILLMMMMMKKDVYLQLKLSNIMHIHY